MQHRADIDGLRSVAVLPVVLFHAGVVAFSGGYVGVDVFFVISGFLITGIIAERIREGRFSYASFYDRRARRILPALFLVTGVTAAVSAYVSLPRDFEYFAKSALATLSFVSNIWFWWRGGDYFAHDLETEPLLHTWSLAVEEQFYIFFPLVLVILYRFFPRSIVKVMAGLVVLSLAGSILGVMIRPVATFYLLPSRAWELGLGALLALGAFPQAGRGRTRDAVGLAGLAAIALAVFAYTPDTPFPGAAALLPACGTAAIIWAGMSGGGLVGRILAWDPAVAVGKISYSLYLWHWPIIVLTKQALAVEHLTPAFMAFVLVLSFSLSFLSYRYVEQPFRTGLRPALAFGWLGSGAVALAAVAAMVVATAGVPARFGPREAAIVEAGDDVDRCPGREVARRRCAIGVETMPPTFALWGDSHAVVLAPAFDLVAEARGLSGVSVANYSCPPLLGVTRPERPGCKPANDRFIEYLHRTPSIRHVVVTARWPLWRSGERAPGEQGEVARLVDSQTNDLSENPQRLFDRAFSETIAALRRRGVSVTIVADVPEIGWDVPTHLLAHQRYGVALPSPPDLDDVRRRQGPVNAFMAREVTAAGGRFVDLVPMLCRPQCMVELGGRPIYMDDNHLTTTAVRRILARHIRPMLSPSR